MSSLYAKECRNRADRLRYIAENESRKDIADRLRELADEYDQMAENPQRKETPRETLQRVH